MSRFEAVLQDPALRLPIEYHDDNGFLQGIQKRLNEYESAIKKYTVSGKVLDAVKEFYKQSWEMYKLYFRGKQHKAYELFQEAIKAVMGSMDSLQTELSETEFYRARKNTGYTDYSSEQMFHIPFNMRHKIGTQRYSFPGLPCLYLGASAYADWVELNRPSFDEFQVAYVVKNPSLSMKVIDLSKVPEKLAIEIRDISDTEKDKAILDYLKLWPVVAMCSIVVKHPDDPFKPEYIFPQFVLEYVLDAIDEKSDLVGIKYASVKAAAVTKDQYKEDWRTYTNYVFPVRISSTSKDEDICPILSNSFKIVRNYSGRELQILSDMIRKNGIVWEDLDNEFPEEPQFHILSSDGKPYDYSASIFGRIENALHADSFDQSGQVILKAATEEDINALFADMHGSL